MKNTTIINTIYGTMVGLVSGAAAELLMLNAIFNKLPARSIAVGCIVSGVAWAIAGGVICYNKNKKSIEA